MIRTDGSRLWITAKSPQPTSGTFAHADNALGPIQQRVGVPALDRSVDVLEAVGTAGDDRDIRLVALGETTVRLVRPLHRRPRTVAFRQLQVVAHVELVAVA